MTQADELTPQTIRWDPLPGRPDRAVRRLSFLDALRGLAAVSVALGHRAEATFAGYTHFDQQVFRFGQFGVVLFFICSGFIIPASLERNGSLAKFWKGRFFRLFPLYWVVVSAALIMHGAGLYELPRDYVDNWLMATVLNVTMTQALLGTPLAMGLSWTLAYELVFYVLMSLLFVLSVHRHSRTLAASWGTMALALGLLNCGFPVAALALMAMLAMANGRVAWRTAAGGRRILAGSALMVVGAGLVLSRHAEAWLNVSYIAVMFSGTILYRHYTGVLSRRSTLTAYSGVGILIFVTVAMNAEYRSWTITFAAAFLIFGVFYLLRHRRFSRSLIYLGTISYSIYLLHPLVFALVPRTEKMATVGLLLAILATIALAAMTYRCVEVPMIALGRKPWKRPRLTR